MVDLLIDFLKHLLGKDDVLVSALEVIFAGEVGMLVEDDLIHIELVEVCIQQ